MRDLGGLLCDHVALPAAILANAWVVAVVVAGPSPALRAAMLMLGWVAAIGWAFFGVAYFRSLGQPTVGDVLSGRTPMPDGPPAIERAFVHTLFDVASLGAYSRRPRGRVDR